jgi:ABC-type sugar transport system ATPase subunit
VQIVPLVEMQRITKRFGAVTVLEDVSLEVRPGEVHVLAGENGAGKSTLMKILGGVYADYEGVIRLRGQPAHFRSPRQAMRHGLALVTSDRKATGLVMPLSVTANSTLADLPRLSPGGWRRPGRETAAARRLAQRLALRAPSLEAEVGVLSGGNQQKVVLGKWLQREPRVLLLDEPTRGVDVGAKEDVYAHNDPGAHGAFLAAKAAGREKGLRFVGIDALPQEGVAYVQQGILDATFQYPTGGAEAIDCALKILRKEPVAKEITLGSRVFDKSNVATGGAALP